MSLEPMCRCVIQMETDFKIKGTDIADVAMEFLGVKWRHQGRSRYGIDCVGLLIVAANRLIPRLHNYDIDGYGRLPSAALKKEFDRHMIEVPRTRRAAGLVLLFDQMGTLPYHAAIMTDHSSRIVHAYWPARKVIVDDLKRNDFERNLRHVMAFPEVEY